MAKTLSNATKSAANSVSRLTGKTPKSTDAQTRSAPTSSNPIAATRNSNAVTINADRRVAVTVPGLFSMTEGSIAPMMPPFNPNAYQITDPLKPPATIPQVDITQFEQGKGIYEGGIRAAQLTGLAMDLSREKFTVVSKQAKAVTAGFTALGDQEKAKGALLDYHTQQEVMQQKGLLYQLSAHKTSTETQAFPYAIVQLDEALEQQRIKAELAKAKREEAAANLNAFQQSLGKFLSPTKSAQST